MAYFSVKSDDSLSKDKYVPPFFFFFSLLLLERKEMNLPDANKVRHSSPHVFADLQIRHEPALLIYNLQ